MAQTVKFRIGNLSSKAEPGPLACFLGLKPLQKQCLVELVLDSNTGDCKGYGFITVPLHKATDIMQLNGLKYHELPMMISRAPGDGDRVEPLGSSPTKITPKKPILPPPAKGKQSAQDKNPTKLDTKEGVLTSGSSVNASGDPSTKPTSKLLQAIKTEKPDGDLLALAQSMKKMILNEQGQGKSDQANDASVSTKSSESGPSRPNASAAASSARKSSVSSPKKSASPSKKPSGSKPRRRSWNQKVATKAGNDLEGWGGAYCNYLSDTEYAYLNKAREPQEEEEEDYSKHNYSLIDASAILTHSKFKRDVELVICRAQLAGVRNIVVTALDIKDSKAALSLATAYKGYLYCTAGIHPHTAEKTYTSDSLQQLEELARHPECVAIGECGLDYNRNFSPRDRQLEVFEKQVQLACRLKKPLLLHTRDSEEDFLRILRRHHNTLPPVLVHCFTGSKKEALKYLAMGFYIGVTGYIWRDSRKDGIRSLLHSDEIPMDKLIIESDSPFMQPRLDQIHNDAGADLVTSISAESFSHWHQCAQGRNEPCALPAVVEIVAACWGRSPHQVAKVARENAKTFFGIQD